MTRMSASERRAALIRAGLRVVADRGVARATTRAIVAEAGMSLASFHYAFSGRDELMAELVNAVVAQETRTLAPAFAHAHEAPTAREAIRAGLQQFFDGVKRDPQHEKAMFELTQYAMRAEGTQPLAVAQYGRYYALATDALAAVSTGSRVHWTQPIEQVATLLVALTDGLTFAWLVNRDDRAAEAIMDFAADAVAALATPTDESRRQ